MANVKGDTKHDVNLRKIVSESESPDVIGPGQGFVTVDRVPVICR